MNEQQSQPPSHSAGKVGAGIAAGAALGMALGVFLQSRKGKALTRDAMKKAAALQKQIMKKIVRAEKMTKATYEELVEEAVAFYQKTKEIAANEVPVVKKQLMSKWKEVEKHLKAA